MKPGPSRDGESPGGGDAISRGCVRSPVFCCLLFRRRFRLRRRHVAAVLILFLLPALCNLLLNLADVLVVELSGLTDALLV